MIRRPVQLPVLACFRDRRAIVATQLSNRSFHDYFVTHLPSSSLHPDSRSPARPGHKLPRDESTPHDASGSARSPAVMVGMRDTTVVRIPLKSAKHHFGASNMRGTRPYNEDTYQAGTIEIPAFAKKAPISLSTRRRSDETAGVDSASGDPQVFYFGIFDGHGGDKCSIFLRQHLHGYIEDAAKLFGLPSSLQSTGETTANPATASDSEANEPKFSPVMDQDEEANTEESEKDNENGLYDDGHQLTYDEMESQLVHEWKSTVGGYFRRFKPEHFAVRSGGQGQVLSTWKINSSKLEPENAKDIATTSGPAIDNVLTYSFLKADLDFVKNQAAKDAEVETELARRRTSSHADERPINERETHHHSPSHQPPQMQTPPSNFLGGSTCSVILISTPTPTPFWHPSTPSTLITAHCGDTRIILCNTSSGDAVPLTSDHHPSLPTEAARLRRYAGAFTTDSFGEERISGLANTRAFGDMRSKRLGVSAEPEIRLVNIKPAECSFLVLVSDGVSGTLSDQEIVDIVKEGRTPEEASRAVTSLATEIAGGEKGDADNATCLVVRLGGWERRSEGGVGSLGTKEKRDWRLQSANDPRAGRT